MTTPLSRRLASMPAPTASEHELVNTVSMPTMRWLSELELDDFKRLLAYRRAVQAGFYTDHSQPAVCSRLVSVACACAHCAGGQA